MNLKNEIIIKIFRRSFVAWAGLGFLLLIVSLSGGERSFLAGPPAGGVVISWDFSPAPAAHGLISSWYLWTGCCCCSLPDCCHRRGSK